MPKKTAVINLGDVVITIEYVADPGYINIVAIDKDGTTFSSGIDLTGGGGAV